MITIFTLTSPLHDERLTSSQTAEFLGTLHSAYQLAGGDFAGYGKSTLDLIYVTTGGTEGLFKQLLPRLRQTEKPIYLLTSGKSNSLAASMEILSFLRQQGMRGEIIHGTEDYVNARIERLHAAATAAQRLHGTKFGIIGQPSDWLISSNADKDAVKRTLGIELLDIAMDELVEEIGRQPEFPPSKLAADSPALAKALPGAERIYLALKHFVEKYSLSGLTIRCFDLLSAVKNTGCLALARLNSEGIVAGCEGDVPAMLSMAVAMALTGKPSFQANPSSINAETGEILFAHCTIPFSLLSRFELDTHFESGIGVAIRGYVEPGPVTIFKVSGDLKRCFAAQGQLVSCHADPGLCRTQQLIKLDEPQQARYFLTEPIGNHHIIIQGHHKAALEQILL